MLFTGVQFKMLLATDAGNNFEMLCTTWQLWKSV